MVLIKYLFLAILSLGIFVLAVFDVNAMDFVHKGGIILAFIIGLVILNFFARIAWKLLILIIFITLLLYTLNYFGIIEFSVSGISDFFKSLLPAKTEAASTAASASSVATAK